MVGQTKILNPDLIRTEWIKLHVSKSEKTKIVDHFGKGTVSRKIRELILDHIYVCSGCK